MLTNRKSTNGLSLGINTSGSISMNGVEGGY